MPPHSCHSLLFFLLLKVSSYPHFFFFFFTSTTTTAPSLTLSSAAFISHSIGPTFPRASSNFSPFFFCPLLKFFPASSLSFSVSRISASVTPTQRIAAVRSSCVRARLYPSESVSGGIHFTHVLRRFKRRLIHIHQCNLAYFQKNVENVMCSCPTLLGYVTCRSV